MRIPNLLSVAAALTLVAAPAIASAAPVQHKTMHKTVKHRKVVRHHRAAAPKMVKQTSTTTTKSH